MRLTDSIENKVKKYLEKWNIKCCNILIGCSGGPDSTALLALLIKLKKIRKFKLSCAYLNHGLRKKEETSKDKSFLKEICKKYNVDLFIENIEYGSLKNLAHDNKKSIEEIAREKRYDFFNKIKVNITADYIALGHNQDDEIETVLMRFMQGVNFTGLCGIPEKRLDIIRPIINCTKQEILVFLDTKKIKYRIDKTNIESKHLRNKIRNILIPEIINIFPGFKQAVSSLSDKMKMLADYFDNSVDLLEDWKEIRKNNEIIYKIKKNEFINKPDIIRIQSIYKLYNKITNYSEKDKYYQIPYRFLSDLKDKSKIIKKNIVLKGYSVILYKKGQWLFFKRDVVGNTKKGYLIVVNGNNYGIIKDINLQYKIVLEDKKEKDMLSLDVNKITMPIIIRSKKPGDFILTKNGNKSLKKLFIEWKIPEKEKWKIPVIADKNGILGILGKPLGFFNKYSDEYSFKVTKKFKNSGKMLNIIINKYMENN